MAGGAFLVHRVNYALMLIREKTLLPFLFYALLTSTNPDFFPLKSTSVGVFCLILAFISYLPLIMTRTLRIRLITHPWLSVSEVCCGYTSFGSCRCFGWGCIISGHWISGPLSLPCWNLDGLLVCFRMVCLGMGFHGIYHTFHLLIQDPFPCGTRDGN